MLLYDKLILLSKRPFSRNSLLSNLCLEWGLNAVKFIIPYSVCFPFQLSHLVHAYAVLENLTKKCFKVFTNHGDIMVTITKFGMRKQGKNGISITPNVVFIGTILGRSLSQIVCLPPMSSKLRFMSDICSSLVRPVWDRGPCHIETSPLICRANQWTGFYMIRTSVMKELMLGIIYLVRS